MKRWNAKKFGMNMLKLMGIMLVAWVMISYFEIITKNVHPDPQYSEYNLLVNLVTILGGII